jgi:hypothetical protein
MILMISFETSLIIAIADAVEKYYQRIIVETIK